MTNLNNVRANQIVCQNVTANLPVCQSTLKKLRKAATLFLTALLFSFTQHTAAQEIFQFEVTVPDDGTFSIPLSGRLNNTNNKPYNWYIDWGDGTQQNIANTDSGAPQNSTTSIGIPHTYSVAGVYTITITPDASTDAWFAAFGFYNNTSGANIQSNKDMLTKVLSPITPLMTRTQEQLNAGTAPHMEWAYTFFYCRNILMGQFFSFNHDWNNITNVGINFAIGMFDGCSGNSFTMNEIFNLPSAITIVGDGFANSMFRNCSGTSFSMNEIFNFPSEITTIGNAFANGMFFLCSGDAFAMNDIFNLPSGITTVGDGFSSAMFANCSGNSFTMNEIFNLPNGIITVGNIFAIGMFDGCSGNSFTMNEIFNLPSGITTVGNNFVNYMFRDCSGTSFAMNDIFNLPNGITTVGNNFAQGMFRGCSGNSFTMNEIFNLPSGITTVGGWFAQEMFSGCSGASFKINNIFKFPLLSQTQLNQSYVFYRTFYNLGSGSPQTRYASSIINGNSLPSSSRFTFSGSPCFVDIDYIHTIWGGGGQTPPPPIITTPSPLPNGEVENVYNFALSATSHTQIMWYLNDNSNSLPPGLTLSADGEIYGTPTVAGIYNFSITAENSGGFDSKDFTITIEKGTPNVTFPTNATLVYGQTLAEAIFDGHSGDGTFEFTNSTFAPTVAQSGESFEMMFTPTDDANYNSATQDVIVTVNQAEGSFITIEPIPTTYTPTLTLADLELPAGYEWENPATSLNAGDNQQFAATYTDPSGNYTTAQGNIIVNVAKAEGIFEELAPITAIYSPTLTLADLEIPAGYEWENPATSLNVGDNQQFAATYTDPSGNYTPAQGNITVNVAKAEGIFEEIAPIPAVYTPTLSLSDLELPDEYEWENPETSLNAGDNQQFAATYTDPSGNYTTAEGNITVNVAKAEGIFEELNPILAIYSPTLTLADLEIPADYEWENPEASLNAGDNQQFTATYTDPSGNYTTAQGNITVNVAKAEGSLVETPIDDEVGTTTISIYPISPPSTGQSVEYAIDLTNVTPNSGWQFETLFEGLTENTTYFIFARSAENENYNAGAASEPLEVKTEEVGIDNISQNGKLQVYPNPTTGEFSVFSFQLSDVGSNNIRQIEIFDAAGRIVHRVPCTVNRATVEIDISHLSNGIYFVKVGNEIVKIVKK